MIGSTIAHLAVKSGAQVTILDAMLPPYGGNLFNLHGIFETVKFVQGDIREVSLLKSLVPGMDYIFSLAGQVSYVLPWFPLEFVVGVEFLDTNRDTKDEGDEILVIAVWGF